MDFTWNKTKCKIIFISNGKMNESIANHSHSTNSYELHFVFDGFGKIKIKNNDKFEEYTVSKNYFYVTGGGIEHEQIIDENSSMNELCIYIQVQSTKTNDAMVDLFLSNHFWVGKHNINQELITLIYEEYNSNKIGHETIVAGLMNSLLTYIIRLYSPKFDKTTLSTIDLNDKRLYLIECAFLYHPKDLTLESLSNEIGICERQTQRIIKKYYNLTFREKKKMAINNIKKM